MNKKFLILWIGEFISSIGSGLTSFGLGVYVFKETGSAGAMALITLLAFIPMLILGIPAGVLADRYDRRILMMIGDGFSVFGLIYILICVRNGGAKLWQICLGVTISAIFSSLLDPAYKATVTDLVDQKDYTKASGMVNIASSSRYILAPFIAGLILSVWDIQVILIFDICTFFVTVTAIWFVKKGIKSNVNEKPKNMLDQTKEGFMILRKKKGVLILAIYASLINLFMGFIQVLSEPLVLSFASSKTLGFCETICAMGMLVSSVVLGIKSLKKNYVKITAFSLFFAGIAMIFFGLFDNISLITISGFVFFMTLPFANGALDYLVRSNIDDELQGRVWGVIGVISLIGSAISYAISGVIADCIGNVFHIGVGRGAGYSILVAGIIMAVIALFLLRFKSVRELER